MDPGNLFFWLGMAGLVGMALILRRFATDGRQGQDPPPAAVAAGEVVRTFRRGRVRLAIWADRTPAGGVRHHVSVDRRGPDCGDCMGCVDEALRWIQEGEARA